MRKKFIRWMLPALLPILGCGGSTATDPVSEGWTFFSSGQYAEAHASFVTAVQSGANEGNVGLGWVCIDLDSLQEADRYFGLAAADNFVNGYSGWSAVLWAQGNYANCIAKSDFVLQTDPFYTFEFRPAVNYQDMVWYQASSYLHLGNYNACMAKIQALDVNFTTDLNAANVGDVLAAKLEILAGQLLKQML